MVVALDLERDGEPVSQVENARVLTWALQDSGTVARQATEQERGVLVPAVLRPEEREHRELEVVRLALEQRDDTFELLVREAEPAVERRFRDGAQEVILPGPSATAPRCGHLASTRRHGVARAGYGRAT
jgi:hypothetical protein